MVVRWANRGEMYKERAQHNKDTQLLAYHHYYYYF